MNTKLFVPGAGPGPAEITPISAGFRVGENIFFSDRSGRGFLNDFCRFWGSEIINKSNLYFLGPDFAHGFFRAKQCFFVIFSDFSNAPPLRSYGGPAKLVNGGPDKMFQTTSFAFHDVSYLPSRKI